MKRKTQLRLWIGATLFVAAIMAWSSEGRAETLKARNTTSVFTSQGEKSRVVTRVPAGKTMTVLRKEGRWIKVRVNGLTGWITRSSATESHAAARATTTSNRKVSFVEGRSRKEKLETGPTDRVGGDAVEEEQFDDDLSEVDDSGDGKPNAGEEDEEEAAPPPKKKKVAVREKKAKKRSKPAAEEEEFDDSESGDDESSDSGDSDDSDDSEEASGDDEDSGSDTVVVVADEIKLRSKPSKKSKSVESASAGDELSVIERDGDWIKVETSDGEEGWVRADDVGEAGAYQYKKMAIVANGGLAFRRVGQTFSSNSTDPLGNYKISSGAFGPAIGGDLLYDYSDKYLVGGDLGFAYVLASPGIRFTDPDTDEAVDIGFKVLQIDAGARGGYKIGRSGLAAYARVGYHYERFSINNVSDFMEANTARLPSEILQGGTIGISVEMPKFAEKYSARVGIDYLGTVTLGKRQQTSGLEDGELSKVSALWGNARVTYQWKEKMQIAGTLAYSQAKTKWDNVPEESQRRHIVADPTIADYEAARTDTNLSLLVGLTRAF